ncbi:MAG: hypothetical protein WA989_05280 [Henriciella sp.]|uniref:hypothetical protein n=1 Tax=Henriciella sp. TaxID=1968823 RepID=UPI003C762C48
MSSTYEICRAIRHLEANPRDLMGMRRLDNHLRQMPAAQFIHGARDSRIAASIYKAAGNVVSLWHEESERANWISIACFLVKRMEKPKKLPKPKRGAGADLKARAAGEAG